MRKEGTLFLELRQRIDSDSDWDDDDDSFMFEETHDNETSSAVAFEANDEDQEPVVAGTDKEEVATTEEVEDAAGPDTSADAAAAAVPSRPAWLLDFGEEDVSAMVAAITAASQLEGNSSEVSSEEKEAIATNYGVSAEKVDEMVDWVVSGSDSKEEEDAAAAAAVDAVIMGISAARDQMNEQAEALGSEDAAAADAARDAAPDEEGKNEGEESDFDDYDNGFGYKNILRKSVPIPKDYLQLQMAFADAFPWHDAALVCERANGKSIGPSETNFRRDEVIVFREYMPSMRKDVQYKRVMGLSKCWEEDVYEPELKKFYLRSWQKY